MFFSYNNSLNQKTIQLLCSGTT